MSVILWQTSSRRNSVGKEVMKLLQRFKLTRALRQLSAIFETVSTLPRITELQYEGLRSLPMYGQLQACRWKSQLALHDRHQVTNALLRQVKKAKQRGDAQAHSVQIALWHALAAEGIAVSVSDWIGFEFGLEASSSSVLGWSTLSHSRT